MHFTQKQNSCFPRSENIDRGCNFCKNNNNKAQCL